MSPFLNCRYEEHFSPTRDLLFGAEKQIPPPAKAVVVMTIHYSCQRILCHCADALPAARTHFLLPFYNRSFPCMSLPLLFAAPVSHCALSS